MISRRNFIKGSIIGLAGMTYLEEPLKFNMAYGEEKLIYIRGSSVGKVYYGSTEGGNFLLNEIGGIDSFVLIENTEEYDQIQKKKLKHGDGEYYLLMTKATERVLRAVPKCAKDLGKSFVCDLMPLINYLQQTNEDYKNKRIDELVVQFDMTGNILRGNYLSRS